jgi:hypothetical protein
MQKITHYLMVVTLLHSSYNLGMLRIGGRVLRAQVASHALYHLSRKERNRLLKSLERKRSELTFQCFGHGGIRDMMTLGPDKSLQVQFRDYLAQIEDIVKEEERLRRK